MSLGIRYVSKLGCDVFVLHRDVSLQTFAARWGHGCWKKMGPLKNNFPFHLAVVSSCKSGCAARTDVPRNGFTRIGDNGQPKARPEAQSISCNAQLQELVIQLGWNVHMVKEFDTGQRSKDNHSSIRQVLAVANSFMKTWPVLPLHIHFKGLSDPLCLI